MAKESYGTVLFTDIKASSELWSESKDGMSEAIKLHEKQMQRLVKKYDGMIIKSIGDAYMVYFSGVKSLDKAIEMSSALQMELTKTKVIKVGSRNLLLRIGIAYGPILKRYMKIQDKRMLDLFGNTVNSASRMESKVCEVNGIAFTDLRSSHDKINEEFVRAYGGRFNIEVIRYSKECPFELKRSFRLVVDYHCEDLDKLKGVSSLVAYKMSLK